MSRITERAALVTKMSHLGLALELVSEFDLKTLCDRVSKIASIPPSTPWAVQKELVRNPDFERYYSSIDADPSTFAELLEECEIHGKSITDYALKDVAFTLRQNIPVKLTLLHNLNKFTDKATAIRNLSWCQRVPVHLSDMQISLLQEYCAGTRNVFHRYPFVEVFHLFRRYPDSLKIARILHRHNVEEDLTLDEYAMFTEEHPAYIALIAAKLTPSFFAYWRENSCSLYELRKACNLPVLNFGNYAHYANSIYGRKFKNLDLYNLLPDQERLLIYAITHNKKSFIRLVDNNAETFLNIPATSALFVAKLYEHHFNINELTFSTLIEISSMRRHPMGVKFLSPNRQYTFIELKTLYGKPASYFMLYNALVSRSQDYRLLVMRQIINSSAITPDIADNKLDLLARKFDEKPIYSWFKDYDYIDSLKPADVAKILAYYSDLKDILPTIRNRTDFLLAFRNRDRLSECVTIEVLKQRIMEMDSDWLELRKELCLRDEFIDRYYDTILEFLCNDGANIAITYLGALDEKQRKAFLNVVKAELMGQLSALKYHTGDLQRELNTTIPERIEQRWKEPLTITYHDITVNDNDDFFSTMCIGVTPTRTCLAYTDGAYRRCLLSSFDSNKKILYATLHGRIIGRAFLRLTKGRVDSGAEEFTYVDLAADSPAEHTLLFLECSYTSGIGDRIRDLVDNAFVKFAESKASKLGVALVLSNRYHADNRENYASIHFSIYISRSKAGAQYLDSLSGSAYVSDESKYIPGTFLMRSDFLCKNG